MTSINFERMNLDELRQYILTHREDVNAFYAYIDRSKAEGRMIAIDLDDKDWEAKIGLQIEQD